MSFDEILSGLAGFSFLLNILLAFFTRIVWNRFKTAEKSISDMNSELADVKSRQDVMEATHLTKEEFRQGLKELGDDLRRCINNSFDKGDEEDKRLQEAISTLNTTVSRLETQLEERNKHESKH